MANALPMNRSIIALALALTASPAFADGPEYPPGLFENSPLVPSGPPHAAIPSEPSDADVPFEPPDPVAASRCGRAFRTPGCGRPGRLLRKRRLQDLSQSG
jgi:hypothetical protein